MTAPTETAHRIEEARGKQIHNLVVVYDSGPGAEFRVQCEVPLSVEEAHGIMAAIAARNIADLETAKTLMHDRIMSGASKLFRETVERAFDDNIAYLREHHG